MTVVICWGCWDCCGWCRICAVPSLTIGWEVTWLFTWPVPGTCTRSWAWDVIGVVTAAEAVAIWPPCAPLRPATPPTACCCCCLMAIFWCCCLSWWTCWGVNCASFRLVRICWNCCGVMVFCKRAACCRFVIGCCCFCCCCCTPGCCTVPGLAIELAVDATAPCVTCPRLTCGIWIRRSCCCCCCFMCWSSCAFFNCACCSCICFRCLSNANCWGVNCWEVSVTPCWFTNCCGATGRLWPEISQCQSCHFEIKHCSYQFYMVQQK